MDLYFQQQYGPLLKKEIMGIGANRLIYEPSVRIHLLAFF